MSIESAVEVEQFFCALTHAESSLTKPSTFRLKDFNWPSSNVCRVVCPKLEISPLRLIVSERSTLFATKNFTRQSATPLLTLPLIFSVRLDNGSEVCSKWSPRNFTLRIVNSPHKCKVKVVKVCSKSLTLEMDWGRENEASTNSPCRFGWSVIDFHDLFAADAWILSTTSVQCSGTSPRTFNTRECNVPLNRKPFASKAAPWLLTFPWMTILKEFKVVSSESPSLKAEAKQSSMSPNRVNEKDISDLLDINSLRAWTAVLPGTP